MEGLIGKMAESVQEWSVKGVATEVVEFTRTIPTTKSWLSSKPLGDREAFFGRVRNGDSDFRFGFGHPLRTRTLFVGVDQGDLGAAALKSHTARVRTA